jgi:protein SCO1/2
MKRLRIALWMAVAIATAALGYLYLSGHDQNATAGLIPGQFRLESTRGVVVDSAALRGKPYAVFFGFTRCPEVCPTTLNDLAISLGELGEAGRTFELFFVTVDPERDDLATLKQYLGSFDVNVTGLRPEPAALASVAQQFRVFYEKSPTSDGSYTMNHTASVFLFDGEGQFSGTIAFGEQAATRSSKLKRLIEAGG